MRLHPRLAEETRPTALKLLARYKDLPTETRMNPTADLREDIRKGARMLTPSLVRAGFGLIPDDRRREVRRAVHLQCCVVRRTDGRRIGDRTVDLSPEGMLVLSDECTDEDAELFVTFRATELHIRFDTSATVTRIVQGRRRGDEGRALGLRFQSLPAVSRLILRGHLRNLPRPIALREPPPKLAPRGDRIDYAQVVRRILADRAG
jgi:PilZ domain